MIFDKPTTYGVATAAQREGELGEQKDRACDQVTSKKQNTGRSTGGECPPTPEKAVRGPGSVMNTPGKPETFSFFRISPQSLKMGRFL